MDETTAERAARIERKIREGWEGPEDDHDN